MKFTIESASLNAAMGWTRPIVERVSVNPVLSNVLIDASSGRASFLTSNSDIEIRCAVMANIERAGATTLPASVLGDIARRAPEGQTVEFDLDPADDQVFVKVMRAEYRLATLPREDFPVMEDEEFDTVFTVDGESLARMLDAVKFAISPDDTRRYLNGAYFQYTTIDGGESRLVAVATDGFVMARARMPAPPGSESLAGVIIPNRAVSELLRCLPSHKGDVEVHVSERKIFFATPKFTLTSRLVEGDYPQYERLIPTTGANSMVAPANGLAASLQRLAAVLQQNAKTEPVLSLDFSEGRLDLQIIDKIHGKAEDQLAVEYLNGEHKLKFNQRTMLTIFSQFGEAPIRLTFQDDPRGSAIIEEVDNPDLIYVIMPIA